MEEAFLGIYGNSRLYLLGLIYTGEMVLTHSVYKGILRWSDTGQYTKGDLHTFNNPVKGRHLESKRSRHE